MDAILAFDVTTTLFVPFTIITLFRHPLSHRITTYNVIIVQLIFYSYMHIISFRLALDSIEFYTSLPPALSLSCLILLVEPLIMHHRRTRCTANFLYICTILVNPFLTIQHKSY